MHSGSLFSYPADRLCGYTGAEHPNDVAADVLKAALMDRPEP